jgi:hypothetical protein
MLKIVDLLYFMTCTHVLYDVKFLMDEVQYRYEQRLFMCKTYSVDSNIKLYQY